MSLTLVTCHSSSLLPAPLPLATWQEQMQQLVQAAVPRIIIGGADGRIRVFDDGELTGYIMVTDSSDPNNSSSGTGGDNSTPDYSPHDGCVNALALDERTK